MVFNILGGALGLYKVVPVNEAHVRVMNGKREEFSADTKPHYWVIPFITKLQYLPKTNLRIEVPDVKLNDNDMAKFSCDMVCFVRIKDVLLAAERTQLTVLNQEYEDGMGRVAQDFRAILESIGRTVATQQTILELYMNRQKLDETMTKEVQAVFPRWGLELVDLEIKDIKDIADSTIIQDIEKKIAAQITADARVKTAQEIKRAAIAEAQAIKEAELVKAATEEEWKKRAIEKDREIALAEQNKELEVAEQRRLANEKTIEAERKLTVGQADIDKEATIKKAEGEATSVKVKAQADAEKTLVTGTSEADVIKLKKLAEAEGTEKLALAQQKFNDAATNIELIRANKEVGIAYAASYGEIAKNANINIVSGDSQSLVNGGLLGDLKVGGKEGAALKQFISTADSETIKKLASIFTQGKNENKENE